MKKIFWITKLIIFGLMSLLLLLSVFESIAGDTLHKGWIIFWTVICIIFIVLFFRTLLKDRCPKCKKLMALEVTDNMLCGEKKISILAETKRYDNNHNVIGTEEQYIPGTRRIYEIVYGCKYCGYTKKEQKTVDSKDV